MSRFLLSRDADSDLDEIETYLDSLPAEPAMRSGSELFRTLNGIGDNPYLGATHSFLTLALGAEVRSRFVHPYRIFYKLSGKPPEIIAILHAARDIDAILSERFSHRD